MICDRCGEEIDRGYPLDAIVHPNVETVGECCIRPGDEVVDP